MRNLLGMLLALHGALFYAVGLLAWFYLTLVAFLSFAGLIHDPATLLIGVGVGLGLVVLFTMGHLMTLFGLSMSSPLRPPFPSQKPGIWFVVKSLQQLTAASFVSSILSIPGLLIATRQPLWTPLVSLAASILLGLILHQITRGLAYLEIPE